jgi:hypothetical protein
VGVLARPTVVSSVFYGYPAELVAKWCCVPLHVAESWKAGRIYPSPAEFRLFTLYRDRKVLTDEWDGWIVKRELLVDPDGAESTQGQLRAYHFVYQLAYALVQDSPANRQRLDAIVREEVG